ncbi:MAG TPA: PAS domain S-box protein [Burkholderiales bacterium]|nr:PAS domain S-box protein [Burkholderiales bacterium]
MRSATIAIDTSDPALGARISDLLTAAGHRIVQDALSGKAIDADLWILDAPPLEESGELVERLKRRPDGVYVPLMALLRPDDADSEGWLDAGFDEVLRLPLMPQKLFTRLRILLRLRQQSVIAAHESAASHNAILDSAIDAVVTFDERGAILEFNPAAESMFQIAREEILGKQMFERLMPPELTDPYLSSFEEYLATGRSLFVGRRAEVQAMRASGEQFPAEINVTKIEAHGYTSFTAFIRDLSERKRAEAGLAQLAAIVESSEEAIISMTLEGVITTWNRGAERLFGYGPDEAAGRPFHMVLPQSRTVELSGVLMSVALGRRYMDFDAVGVHKDASFLDVALSVSPIRGQAGNIIGASVIAYDMTERKRARQALQESEERYRSLVAATTSIVWTSDGEGRFTHPQDSWGRYTGQDWPAHAKWGWAEMFHPEDREPALAGLHQAVLDQVMYERIVRLHHAASGEYRYCSLRAVPILAAHESIREWIGTITDVHDAKQAEAAIQRMNVELEQRVAERTADLAAANRELEAFTYSVSHDLRAPLRAIAGFSRIVVDNESTDLSPEAQRLMLRIGANVDRMDALITDLLSFSRMSRMPLAKRSLAPDTLAREVVEELLAEHPGRAVVIQVRPMPDCLADPSLLQQVFTNLISNAVKYTRGRDPSLIEVGVKLDEDKKAPPIYYVRDNGMGFDMRYASKLFQVFERLHSTDQAEGTGVGLALVRRIVERHGGTVWAEALPDHGATFFFTLEPVSSTYIENINAIRPAA